MRADRNTQGATLASLLVYYDFSCHLGHYTNKYVGCKGKLFHHKDAKTLRKEKQGKKLFRQDLSYSVNIIARLDFTISIYRGLPF